MPDDVSISFLAIETCLGFRPDLSKVELDLCSFIEESTQKFVREFEARNTGTSSAYIKYGIPKLFSCLLGCKVIG